MRLGLIAGILALTGLVFFSSIQSHARTSAGETLALADATIPQHEAAALTARIAELEGEVNALDAARDALATKLASADALSTQAQAHASENAALTQAIEDAQGQVAQLQAALSEAEAIEDAQGQVAQLQAALSEAEATLEAKTEDLALATEQASALDAQNAELQATLLAKQEQSAAIDTSAFETQIASLQSALADKDTALASAEEHITELTADVASATLLQSDLDQLMLQLSSTEADLAEREAEIAQLQSSTGASAVTPEAVCQDQFDTLLVGQSIEFEPGSTTLTSAALPILESAATMAISCAQVGLHLEIEGHTHSEGGEASNLLLSNGRANTVYAFLIDKGVPSDAMRPIGFGESDPIADNATPEGQQINQRIAFDWEQK